MKIKYKVLWIEDHFDSVEDAIDGIGDRLANYGFKFEINRINSLSSNELEDLSDRLAQYNPYDMIIFDYDLGEEQKKGNEIARNLRRSIFTDMIFYSGNAPGKLRQVLFDSEVEGVFIVSRTELIDEAWLIIEDQIKRICDINNMRGVILDEMSKVDLKLRELYTKKYEKLSDEKQTEQVNKIQEKLNSRIRNIEKLVKETTTDSMPDMVKSPIKTEFNIIRTRLKKLINDGELFSEQGKLKSYQDLRNKFAHNMAVYDEEKGTVSLEGFEETYNFNDFTDIRLELIEILKQLNNFDQKD
ncbi:MAG: hypothetical protein D3913_05460 [Candidatus Electrothrix sp. LOE1_4_5]|nr:hypothetical protein [Candidatus Electrothrix gigas]MCI5190663.1 hypothetical protein [Candidatus Electrothrix gigas]